MITPESFRPVEWEVWPHTQWHCIVRRIQLPDNRIVYRVVTGKLNPAERELVGYYETPEHVAAAVWNRFIQDAPPAWKGIDGHNHSVAVDEPPQASGVRRS